MVHKRFVNSFGPEYGEDDRTDFLYDKKEHSLLKELIDGMNITIYRDGDAVKGGNLDVLIRRAKPQSGVETSVDMIPVHGAISHVETPWSASSEENYKTFSRPERFGVGIMDHNKVIKVLDIWYSKEAYLEKNPKAQLDTKDTIREHTPQKPIEITIPRKKD